FGDAAAHGIPTHVTLLPPTEVDAAIVPAVEAHLSEVAASGRPFPMRLSGTGTFRPLSPVVFVKVVEGAEACAWLQGRIRDASGPVARELQFPYHPHVTVAHGIEEAAMDRAFEELSGYEAEWPCTGFALYEQGGEGPGEGVAVRLRGRGAGHRVRPRGAGRRRGVAQAARVPLRVAGRAAAGRPRRPGVRLRPLTPPPPRAPAARRRAVRRAAAGTARAAGAAGPPRPGGGRRAPTPSPRRAAGPVRRPWRRPPAWWPAPVRAGRRSRGCARIRAGPP